MSRAAQIETYKTVPLGLIDEPDLPMRQAMDQQALADLADSIRQIGVVQPIVLARRGERYVILDGHRRYTAAQMVGLRHIPAVIRDAEASAGEAIKVHANLWREDVNPADQAVYLGELLEQHCGGDIDRLCELTRLRRDWVERRLALLLGDPQVFEALRRREITLAVAHELNLIQDEGYRRMYLDAAVRGGATSRMVREWRLQAERIAPVQPHDPGDGTNQHTHLPPPVATMRCVCCDDDEAPWEMELVPMHRRCRSIFLDRTLGRVREALAAALGEHIHGADTR
jgi:ParB/RepB/Spo0J family partition protein